MSGPINTNPVTLKIKPNSPKLTVDAKQNTKINIEPQQQFDVDFGDPVIRVYNTENLSYEGSYTIIPTTQSQILSTTNLWMKQDLTIAPIPKNYGLISWNGSVLTIT